MKKSGKIKQLSLALLSFPIFLTSCEIFKNPQPKLPAKLEVRVFNITNERPALKINGEYYNANNYSFTFKGGDLDLMLDSFFLGHVHIDTTFNVPANSLFTVPVVVEPDFEALGKTNLNLADSVFISFKGDMKGSVGWFSRKVHIDYKGKHYIDLKM
ncbi:NDR1/HIN1-like protein [Chitinophaga silvatica]|nr:LEA type 2 family protein [Chitinophaga silvatica]